MDDRIVDFVRGLRAAGVRVSLSESVDAFRATKELGVGNKWQFRESLRATLVKEYDDFLIFDELFPLYFSSTEAPLQNAMDELSLDDQDLLKSALQAMSGQLDNLLDWLTSGDGPSKEELEEMARRAGSQWADNPREARWVTRRMLQQMGFGHLEEKLQELYQKLKEMGMSDEAIAKLMGVVEANRDSLEDYVAQQVGLQVAQQRANRPDELHGSDLMHKSFGALSADEKDILRKEVGRLVTQLRSRASLRRKRGRAGKFDAKGTIRANLRHAGVPFELKLKKKKLKPSIVLICDVSGSMVSVAEFMLRFLGELNDQISKSRSFAFYADLAEIETDVFKLLKENQVEEAFHTVRNRLPGRAWGTDLGTSLVTFSENHMDAINGRTTLIVLGDGRNNYFAPRLDILKELGRRAKRLLWFTPEGPGQWGSGDSVMGEYAAVCDNVFVVRNLAQLSHAVDKLLES